jgi:soluble lytic murein transglycosylase-like protein
MSICSSQVLSRAFRAARSTLALIGLLVLSALSVPSLREALLQFPIAEVTEGEATLQPVVLASADRPIARHSAEQRALAEAIARRYRVAEDAIADIVSSAYRAGAEYRVDPLLILAVVAVESRFNPFAQSVLGAKGLMQVLPRFHHDKLSEHGGEAALLEPEANIQVGTRILREYLRRSGETEAALQMYVGSDADSEYPNKVLAERSRLQQAVARAKRLAS